MLKIALSLLAFLALTSSAAAQTQLSGVARCERPEPQHTLQVDDRPNHSLTISQTKCTWTKPYEIEGIPVQTCFITSFSESTGDSLRYRGYYTDTMANGDKIYYEMEGTVTLKGGVFDSGNENWKLVRGTGKMAGISARGTCRAQGNSDGSTTWVCEGTYERAK